MNIVNDKRAILQAWTFESRSMIGPSLHSYLETTQSGFLGTFKIKIGDRDTLFKRAREHISRLDEGLNKRFTRSLIQEQLGTLFDPRYLIEHKNDVKSADYGHSAILSLRKYYKRLPNFDSNRVMHEWTSLKTSLSEFIRHLSNDFSIKRFWKDFLIMKEREEHLFRQKHKNILVLMFIYLISPTNSGECERGVG